MYKTIEEITLSNYIRWEPFRFLLESCYRDIPIDHINLYIDLYPIIRSMVSDRYDIVQTDNSALSSYIINMAAHYRAFFRSVYGVYTNIVMVWGYNIPQHIINIIPDYNLAMQHRYDDKYGWIGDLLNITKGVLKNLIAYIQGVYFIQTEFETNVVIYDLIRNRLDNGDGNPNIVISKDPMSIRLAITDPSVAIVRPKKHKVEGGGYGDNSYAVRFPINEEYTKLFWMGYCEERKLKYNEKYLIHPCNLSTILSLTAQPSRNLSAILRYNSVVKLIHNIIQDNPIQLSPESLIANDINTFNNIADIFMARWKALDLDFQRNVFYKNSGESKLMDLEDKVDSNELYNINNRLFQKYPLALDKF